MEILRVFKNVVYLLCCKSAKIPQAKRLACAVCVYALLVILLPEIYRMPYRILIPTVQVLAFYLVVERKATLAAGDVFSFGLAYLWLQVFLSIRDLIPFRIRSCIVHLPLLGMDYDLAHLWVVLFGCLVFWAFGKLRHVNGSWFMNGVMLGVLALGYSLVHISEILAYHGSLLYNKESSAYSLLASVCVLFLPLVVWMAKGRTGRIESMAMETSEAKAMTRMYKGMVDDLSHENIERMMDKHDIMKNLRLLQEFIADGNDEEAGRLVDRSLRTYSSDQKAHEYTGNMYINAFLNYEAALHPDVEIATDIKIRADFGEMNQHLAVLLVNLFDARLRQMPEKGMIQLKMMEHEGILEIKLHSLGYAREEDSQEEMIIQSMLSKLDVVARNETKETTSILLRV